MYPIHTNYLLLIHHLPGHTARPTDFCWAPGAEENWNLSSTSEDNIVMVWQPTMRVWAGDEIRVDEKELEANVLLDVLHPADRARLSRVRGRRRAVAVTRTWVRVEALVKGWRTGLSRDPASVHVGSAARADYGRGWSVSDVRTTARENARLAVAWRTDPAPQG